jgi:TatD DNase family protein
MIDSHCHLGDERYLDDLSDVVARAQAAGLAEALCIIDASDAAEWSRVEAVCARWPNVRLAVGIHPHGAAAFADGGDRLSALVTSRLGTGTLVRAIGEIGLDYHYTLSPRDVQQEVFAIQVRLARTLRLPVVIHTREADADTLRILRDEGAGDVRGVFHCFSGDRALADAAVELGFYVSFSGILTFPKADAIRAAAAVVPADRLLIETDCPYLAPVPHRGKRNEPAWSVRVGETLAGIRGLDSATLSTLVVQNYRDLFRP